MYIFIFYTDIYIYYEQIYRTDAHTTCILMDSCVHALRVPVGGCCRCQEHRPAEHWQHWRICSSPQVPCRVCSKTASIGETLRSRPRPASCPAIWTWVMSV